MFVIKTLKKPEAEAETSDILQNDGCGESIEPQNNTGIWDIKLPYLMILK